MRLLSSYHTLRGYLVTFVTTHHKQHESYLLDYGYNLSIAYILYHADIVGIEPTLTGLESVTLPLCYTSVDPNEGTPLNKLYHAKTPRRVLVSYSGTARG